MKASLPIPHAECVNVAAITGRFSGDRLHRYSLKIPFLDRNTGKFLRVVGQNPSLATEEFADKTIRYLEKFVFQNFVEYEGIEMLNLYTRMDTGKVESVVLDEKSDKELQRSITKGCDVLLVFGKLKNQGAYRFINRTQALKGILQQANLFKIAIGTDYAPHPGNPRILYSRLHLGIDKYNFLDLRCNDT